MSSSAPHFKAFLLQVQNLSGGPGQQAVFSQLNFAWPAGLNWVCGDEGSGKTSLLRILAGDLPALCGTVQTPAGGVFWLDIQSTRHDLLSVQACWDHLQALYPLWDRGILEDLAELLDMNRHRHKQLFMLSTGSRRKVMLIAALASGATVTLLDQPFTALDSPSAQVIKDFLSDAADHTHRAWIVADYEAPGHMVLASTLDLSARP